MTVEVENDLTSTRLDGLSGGEELPKSPFGVALGYIQNGSIFPAKEKYSLLEAQIVTGFPRKYFSEIAKITDTLTGNQLSTLLNTPQAVDLRARELELSRRRNEPVWSSSRVLAAMWNNNALLIEASATVIPLIGDRGTFYRQSAVERIFAYMRRNYPDRNFTDFLQKPEDGAQKVSQSKGKGKKPATTIHIRPGRNVVPKVQKERRVPPEGARNIKQLAEGLDISYSTFFRFGLNKVAMGEKYGLSRYFTEDQQKEIESVWLKIKESLTGIDPVFGVYRFTPERSFTSAEITNLHQNKVRGKYALDKLENILPNIQDAEQKEKIESILDKYKNSALAKVKTTTEDVLPDDVEVLEAIAEEGLKSIQEATKAFLLWVASQAQGFKNINMTAEEKIDIGMHGLIDAVISYDPNSEFTFMTFATRRVGGTILDEARRQVTQSGISRRAQERARVINDATKNLSNALGRTPTRYELSKETGLEVNEIESVQLAYSGRPLSYDALVAKAISARENPEKFYPPDPDLSAEDRLVMLDSKKDLVLAIKKLDLRTQQMITLRFVHDLPLHEIGHRLQISESRVSQLLKRGLKDLRGELELIENGY